MVLGGSGRRRRTTLSHRAAIGVILLVSTVGWGVIAGVAYFAIYGSAAITAFFGGAPEAVEPAAGAQTPPRRP